MSRTVIAFPSGNTTAIVFAPPTGNREQLNSRLTQAWQRLQPRQPQVEQCCSITMPRNPKAIARVEMFGGEFCGNATRSAVWLLMNGQDGEGYIETSGATMPLQFSIQDGSVMLEMPLPTKQQVIKQSDKATIVYLEGIAQIVVTDPAERATQSPRSYLKDLLAANFRDLANQPAVGVSYYDSASSQAEFCVWVRDIRTTFDETACGSGTSAIGVAASLRNQQTVNLTVIQPSGNSINTTATYDDGRIKSYISGRVDILYDGELDLA